MSGVGTLTMTGGAGGGGDGLGGGGIPARDRSSSLTGRVCMDCTRGTLDMTVPKGMVRIWTASWVHAQEVQILQRGWKWTCSA